MAVTFDQLCRQADVTLAKNGLYFAPEHRTCEATARVNVAVRANLDAWAAEEAKHEREKAKLAKENSILAAKLSEAQTAKHDAEKRCIALGLEASNMSPVERERILSLSHAR